MFERILQSHLTRYPDMQIEDVYKLIHQAAMGSEHAINDPEIAHEWMKREVAEMGEGPAEPIIDPISPDEEIIRVHLRTYMLLNGSIENLFEAFIRTANEYRGDVELLENYWETATKLENFSIVGMDNFIQTMKAKNYPAAHHSSEYIISYYPAYRVILRKYCPWLNKLTGVIV
jgi:hypothetical protein